MGPFTGYRKFLFPKLDERGASKEIMVSSADRKLIVTASRFWVVLLISAVIINFGFHTQGILFKIFFLTAIFGNLGATLNTNNANEV